MAVEFRDWMNSSELRNYPLHDQATKQSTDGTVLPDNVISDLNIMVPESAGRFVYISSAAVTPGLVSLTFLATDVDPLLEELSSSSSSPYDITLVPLASITTAKPITIYRNYRLEALYPGVAGWVAFGSGVEQLNASWRFLKPIDGLLCSKAVRAYRDLPVTSLGKAGRLVELTGLIQLQQGGDVLVGKGIRTISGRRREVVTVGLDLTVDAAEMLRKYAGECGARPEDRTCPQGKPLITINGVEPDCNGNIDIIFEGLDVVQTEIPNGQMVDLPIGLDDVCNEFDPSRYDPVDECAPEPSPSSSSSPSSPSSPSSLSPSPSPPAPTEYFDDFSDPERTLGDGTHAGALSPIDGEWYIKEVATSEAIVGRSRLHVAESAAPGFIIHPLINRIASQGYYTFSTIRPYSEDANGYVIFGYKGIDDFWFAGFSIRTLDAPYGYLFVGHKTGDLGSALDNWPRGLEFGHQFDAAGDPDIYVSPAIFPGTLIGIDVRTEVTVSPVSGSDQHLVRAEWFWNRSGQGFPNPTQPFNTCEFATGYDLDGHCGMGASACETHYDNFGIFDIP